MIKVENKETLSLLTKRFMKMNRARNIIAVIAIALTSLLFTSLFVGSVSMILCTASARSFFRFFMLHLLFSFRMRSFCSFYSK